MGIKALREAKYNPRVITDKELSTLDKSYQKFGDLSGIVFNVKTKRLVSGHQRIKALKLAKAKTKIVKKKQKDTLGTVALGFVEVTYKDKTTANIPYREVSWSNDKVEKAANIVANAAGGSFDTKKLTKLVNELEKDEEFDITIIGLKPDVLRNLKVMDKQNDSPPQSFPEVNVDVAFKHTCPRCKYEFD